MEFAFTDDQLAFRDAVRDLLAKECPPAVVRSAWTSADGRSGVAWDALGAMGVLGALVAEAAGGLGLDELDVVLVAEEAGWSALPEPFVEHVLVGAPLVVGEHPDVAVGATTVTAGDPLAPYATVADFAVLLAPDAQIARRTRSEYALETSVDGSRRLGRLIATKDARPLTRAELSQAFWRGTLGYSAQLVGLARRMLAMTVEYASQRRQFGAPIGSFQAVKHQLADVRIAIEFAAPLVYRAAHSLAHGDPEAMLHCSMAKAQSADAATLAARAALQCHGAIGYSFEYDLHLWMKRAWTLARTWGDASWHRDRVARAILDSPTPEGTEG